MFIVLFAVGLSGIAYVYGGYGLLLHSLGTLLSRRAPAPPEFESEWPSVTVLISALNESTKMSDRIRNLASVEYPRERLEVLIVSDGSTDDTVAQATAAKELFPSLDLRIESFEQNRGRHAAQNLAAEIARGDIIVTTDVDSQFDADFLIEIVRPFADERVGVVGGEKCFPSHGSELARSHGLYQTVEYWTRRGEDRWGLLAKTDGPCTAFRRRLWDVHEEFEDVDHSIVALAWDAGLVARHQTSARCFERPSETIRQEIKARSRMTRKGIFTIMKRWPLERILSHPAQSFALYSHRYVRFLSPLWFATAVIGALGAVWGHRGPASALVFLTASLALSVTPREVPILGRFSATLRSFLVANWAFAVGIFGVLRGDRSGRYLPTHQLAG